MIADEYCIEKGITKPVDSIIGKKGKATTKFQLIDKKYEGKIYLDNALWNAICDNPISVDEKVKVKNRDGLILYVDKYM